MKALLLAAVLFALAAPLPLADAYHQACHPDYPCTIQPCDTKCVLVHTGEYVRCVASLQCLA